MNDDNWRALALWYLSLFIVAVLFGVGCIVAVIVGPAGTP